MKPIITPSLWFDTAGEDAAQFYLSVFPNSRIVSINRYGDGGPRPAGSVMTVQFELAGQPFMAINGGPQFTLDEAVSFQISCETSAEVNHYWDKLSEGGQESQCGWLKDKFGLSWQVIPAQLGEVLGDPDPQRAARAMQAMLGMRKLDLDAMRRAADDAPPD